MTEGRERFVLRTSPTGMWEARPESQDAIHDSKFQRQEPNRSINPDVAAVYGAAAARQREHPWMQCSWYGHRVQPLTSPGGAPPPAVGWGIGRSAPSALKSSSKDCKRQLGLLQQAETAGQHYSCSLSRARSRSYAWTTYVIPWAS